MRNFAVAVLALAACTRPVAPLAVPLPSLEGGWRVVAVNGRPSGGKAEIRPPVLAIDFGCNWGSSASRIEGSYLIPVTGMSVTERGCVNADDSPTPAMQHEDEGFRIASRRMQFTFYGPDRVRLSNEAGTIDLSR